MGKKNNKLPGFIEKLIIQIWDGDKPARDYKQFQECRPWPILMYEMYGLDLYRWRKDAPQFIVAAVKYALNKETKDPKTFLEHVNSSLQFDLTEDYVWDCVAESMDDPKHQSIIDSLVNIDMEDIPENGNVN